MKLINNTYKHNEDGFLVRVVTCNGRLATTENLETGETVKFNRGKFEWMIKKGIFVEVVEIEESVKDVEEKHSEQVENVEILKAELTEETFGHKKAVWNQRVKQTIWDQVNGLTYREDREHLVFEDDIADEFLEHIKEHYNASAFDDDDLVEWIREMQHEIIEKSLAVAVTVEQYISDKFDGSQVRFAESQGVLKQQVQKWLTGDFVVIDDELYSKRRDLNKIV